jgi:hypothetical protein
MWIIEVTSIELTGGDLMMDDVLNEDKLRAEHTSWMGRKLGDEHKVQ